MPLPLPTSLSPSKVSSFTDCGLAFRFSAIDHLPEPPSVAATRGTLVHAALERLFCLEPAGAHPSSGPSPAWPRPTRSSVTTPSSPASSSTAAAEATFLAEAGCPGREVLPAGGPHHHHPDRHRAEAGGRAGWRSPPGHHRPPRARRRRRAGGHRLQDGPGPRRAPGAAAAGRRGLLLAAVRAAVRPAPGQGPAPVPGRSRGHHLRPHRPLHPRGGAQAGGGVDGRRASVRAGGLPPQPGPAVRLVRVQGLLPGLRRRHRPADATGWTVELQRTRAQATTGARVSVVA